MLLSNRFSFFDKKGNNINPQKRQATSVFVIDDSEFPGVGAIINAYTNYLGQIIYVEIIAGGNGYGPNTYLEIRSVDNESLLFTIPTANITFGVNGNIESIIIPNSINNADFPNPSLDYFIDFSLERISTGLIAVDQIYVLENVYDLNGKSNYTHPRIENYGPFNINSFSANGKSAKIEIESFEFIGNVKDYDKNVIRRVPSAIIGSLQIGMNVTGNGIPVDTFIFSIDSSKSIVVLTNPVSNDYVGDITIKAYFPHDLRIGSKIYIDGGILDGGPYTITQTSDFYLYFDSTNNIPNTSGVGISYNVTPQFKAYLEGDDSFFLFTVDYNEDFPTIIKNTSISFEFTKASSTDTIPTSSIGGPANNVLYQRTVYDNLEKKPFVINIGHQSDNEGSFLSILRIIDDTFSNKGLIFFGVYRAETEGEDERLGVLLSNIGRDVNPEQELILRDSDVNESNVNNILLNQKRKEMLLQGEQIWPYIGSYKGLVNMINWFGYYDVRLKEYFLNVNSSDAEFGKYRQVPITFQLKEKKQNNQSLNLVPSKHYKKTSLFGLFYDIVKDSGLYDQYGIPITQDAFEFTNEEALIKFFALKQYLKDKFLPLNAQIVGITGEGVYYERYGINTWKNVDERRVLETSRSVDFTTEKRIPIQDLREYSSKTFPSPTLEKNIQGYMNNYDIEDITITNGGGPYTIIPKVNFPGSSSQQATGYCKVKGYTGTYVLSNPTGTNYIGGEIITLGGGTYDTPLRLLVSGVTGGAVTQVDIQEGYFQGVGYSSLPESFSQSLVMIASGSQYEVVSRNGFVIPAIDLGFTVDDIIFLNKGIGYSSVPVVEFTPNIGSASADLILKINTGIPVGNLNDEDKTKKWIDSPKIPVGAILNLSTDFSITWDEIPYSWDEISSGLNGNIKVYIDPLPSGSGEVIAAEITDPGNDYVNVPDVKIVSNEGSGATLQASLRNGKLNVLTFTVTAVASSGGGTNNEFTLNPDIALAGAFNVSTNRLVTGTGINNLVLTSYVSIVPGSSVIIVENTDGTPATTSINVGDVIKIHQGIEVTNGGVGYSNVPGVNIYGGHTRNILSWDNLGRGEFYEMQWKILLEEPVKKTNQFNYDSGIKPIDELINHSVILPYIGKYSVEMIVYNTDNNFSNAIKKNCVEVYMQESDFSYVARFVNESKGTWDSFLQLPNTAENKKGNQILNNRYVDYTWENATGRWVNPVFNTTTWDDMDFSWDTLDISQLSKVNFYTFPENKEYNILEISAEDNLEGPVIEYRDSTTSPSAINPTIIVKGQRIYPEIEPSYNPADEWIFIRRDDTTFQLDVLASDYSNPGFTYIELVNDPPQSFKASPTSWEVLREIGGTIVLPGNLIYDSVTNPTGIQNNKFIQISQKNNTPIQRRIPINGKDVYGAHPSSIIINDKGNDSDLKKKGEIGKIYKIRDHIASNGNLIWDPIISGSTWVIESSLSDVPEIRDHIGRIYINQSLCTSNPIDEIRPGFTIIKLFAYLDGVLKYTQEFRTTHVYLDTSNVGRIYEIWNTSGVYVIDIVGINGGPLDELNNYLLNLSTSGIEDVYLEYEYQEFTTRTYYGENISGNANIYFDFNMKKPSGAFINAESNEFDSTAISLHKNWFFDSGIEYGDFSLPVSQVGNWQNDNGTIITVSDTDNDMFKVSSSFTIMQQNFDEDAAKRMLGTNAITWDNFYSVTWDEMNSHTWDTLDFPTSYWCNFVINNVVQNSGIEFNNDGAYNFTGLVGGMSKAQIYAQSLYELNNNTTGGLARFEYTIISSTSDVNIINLFFDTYYSPDSFETNSSVYVDDVIQGLPFAPVSTVTGVSGNTVTLNKDIRKKAYFSGDCDINEYRIKNITGLLSSQITQGDMITSSLLPSYPSTPAYVVSIQSEFGMVREITLSEPFSGSNFEESFQVEWKGSITTQVMSGANDSTFKILANAKNPGIDCLGYLTGSGDLNFELPNKTYSGVSHTFPTGNFYSWIGFGENKVGSFLNGLDEFVKNYKNIQTYLTEGVDPYGSKGWYPATNLPNQYSYTNSQFISNKDDAEAKSQRLPYERSMSSAFNWEETWAGSKNGKFPIGTSILFTSDTSKIIGKTKYLWRIKNDNNDILAETTDPNIMWTFTDKGFYTIELEIEDTNGNLSKKEKKEFVEIDAHIES